MDPSTSRRRWIDRGATAAVLLLGLAIALRKPLASGFTEVPGDWIDGRFCHYVLEHGHAFLTGGHAHERLFDPPFFHPTPNVLAFSDALVGFFPPYVLLRGAGLDPAPAFAGWVAVVLALDFLLVRALCRRWAGAGPAAATAAAYVATFSVPSLLQVAHPQLLPLAYVLGALLAVDSWLRRLSNGARGWPALLLLAGCLTAQFWSAFYFVWFLLFALGLALLVGLLLPATRPPLVQALRRGGVGVAIAAAVTLAACLPLLLRYLEVAEQLGSRPWSEIEDGLPRPVSWIAPSPSSLLYGDAARLAWFSELPLAGMHALGLGPLTLVVAVVGLWRGRSRPALRVLGLTTAAVMAATTLWPGGWSLFRILAWFLPGADLLRGVARIGLLLPVVLGIGLAATLTRLGSRHALLGGCLALACGLEQLGRLQTYDGTEHEARVARIVSRIDPTWTSFCVTRRGPEDGGEDPVLAMWRLQLDAMWAGRIVGLPTVNGYSGNAPPGWRGRFGQPTLESGVDRRRFRRTLESWVEEGGGDPEGVGWVDLRTGNPPEEGG